MVDLGNLVELILAIESATGNAVLGSELKVAEHLLRICVDHLRGEIRLILEVEVGPQAGKYELHFSLGGTVEATAKCRKETHNNRIRV